MPTTANEQFDYIVVYGDKNVNIQYNVISSVILSDHKMMECIIYSKEGIE